MSGRAGRKRISRGARGALPRSAIQTRGFSLASRDAHLTSATAASRRTSQFTGWPRTTVLLVPQVTLKRRLDVAGAARKWAARLPELVLQTWSD